MFWKVLGFEIRYQLRQPVFWVVAVVFFLLTFGATSADQIHIGDSANVHKNSPYAIAQIHLTLTIFFMFVTTAFAANVVVRDAETGFGPILRSTRIRKFDYLIGRFLAAFIVSALAFLTVPLAIMLGSVMPWLDPDVLGPFHLEPYLYAYVVLALPSLLITAAAFFALATVTRSMMATYVGVVVFFVLWFIATIWSDKPELEHLVGLLEPFGDGAYSLVTKYWTATERNTLTPPVVGVLLWNRAGVVAVSAALLAWPMSSSASTSGPPRPAARRGCSGARKRPSPPPPPRAS